jgi:hypothetical protein
MILTNNNVLYKYFYRYSEFETFLLPSEFLRKYKMVPAAAGQNANLPDYRPVWFVPNCATLCLRLVV